MIEIVEILFAEFIIIELNFFIIDAQVPRI